MFTYVFIGLNVGVVALLIWLFVSNLKIKKTLSKLDEVTGTISYDLHEIISASNNIASRIKYNVKSVTNFASNVNSNYDNKDLNLKFAQKLMQKGSSMQDITTDCNINYAEANLIARLNS